MKICTRLKLDLSTNILSKYLWLYVVVNLEFFDLFCRRFSIKKNSTSLLAKLLIELKISELSIYFFQQSFYAYQTVV